MQYSAEGPTSDYGRAVIRFQNGVDRYNANEPRNWQSKELSNQFLDLTVEVWGAKGGKESVTTRYIFYQQLDDEDMKYTLSTNLFTGDMKQYDCEYVPFDGVNGDYFKVYDELGAMIADPWELNAGNPVTMEMAEDWAGEQQDGGMQSITIQKESGTETMDIHVYAQLMRQRKILGYEGGGDEALDEYKGQDLKFKRVYTR